MALQEVARRVLLGHWIMIVAFVAVSAGAVTAWQLRQAPTYTASTRLVLDAPSPTSLTEATALADGAKAIVTSPSHVVGALQTAGVARDPVRVIRNINLDPEGTSGVLQLSVKDSDPVAAAAIANALADDLIKTRLAVSPVAQRSALNDRITAANNQIAALDQKIADLNNRLEALQVNSNDAQTIAVQAQILADQITADSSQRSALTQQELQLEAERNSLGNSGSLPTPSVIDPASPPPHPDPSLLPILLALAVVIGAILGVGAASVLEIFGPTLAGGEVIAATLNTPLLGRLSEPSSVLRDRLALAAGAADVGAVELLGAGSVQSLSAFAQRLEDAASATEKGFKIFSADHAPAAYRSGPASPSSGFVLVSRERIRKAALKPARNLLAISGRPLLGVIVDGEELPATPTELPQPRPQPQPRPRRRASPRRKPSPRLAVVEGDGEDPLHGMSPEIASDLWGGR